MDFNDFKLFLNLVETRNFSKSAVRNHMSPPTFSRQIQRLEEELGQALFFRDNRRVELTEAGERFLTFAQAQWQEWRRFKRQFQSQQQEPSGELRLFCSVTASYSHLPHILANFRVRYPKVEIRLTTGDPATALHNIQTQQADLALSGRPINLPSSVEFHYIDDIELALIAPRVACVATQLLQRRPIDWQQIPFILPLEGSARQRIDQWFKQKKIKHPKIYATVSGHEGIVPMVALGFGLAMLPDVVIRHSPMNTQVSYLESDTAVAPFELGVCVQKKRLDEPLIKAFWNCLE